VEQAKPPLHYALPCKERVQHDGTKHMQPTLWNLYSRLRNLLLREEGQDLVEYTLLFAVVALAGMQSAAGGVNAVFTAVGVTLSSAIG
jgi:Flp pilus assembly pilin Flp